MTLPLTPQILEAAYEYLRATPPFRGWKLPAGEEVEFHVTRHADQEGDHVLANGTHTIRISSRSIGHTVSLMAVMAHEMLHGKQARDKLPVAHNEWFRQQATKVCKYHGFDPKTFARYG